jgi:hypothetical protein
MAERQRPDTVEQLLEVIRSDFREAPAGMSQDDFDRLCSNIARAISVALEKHEGRYHQISPEFGEPQRPED